MTPRPERPLYDRRRWLLKLVGAGDAPAPPSQDAGPAAAAAPATAASPAQPPAQPVAQPRPRNRAPAAVPSVRINSDSGDPTA